MSEENKKPIGEMPRVSINYEMFEGWIVTALEGGSNYWCDIPKESFDSKLMEAYKDDNISLSVLLAIFIWKERQTIAIFDAISNEEIGKISMKSVKKALEIICENHGEVFDSLLAETYDADDADVFFQYATLGELTFG